MDYKDFKREIKLDGDQGTIAGYGAVFGNVDRGGDRILPGAFKRSLSERTPKMVWQHDMADPIGVWTEVREDSVGLFVKGRLSMGATKGRDAHALLKDGALDGLSIGYVTKKADMNDGVRDIAEVDLFEVSPVTIQMNELARVVDVKHDAPITVRDIEGVLRTLKESKAGLSNSAIKAMASAAWDRHERILREADVLGPEIDQREVDELKQDVTKIRELFKGGLA